MKNTMTDYYKNISRHFLSLSLKSIELKNAQLEVETQYLKEIQKLKEQSKYFTYKSYSLEV